MKKTILALLIVFLPFGNIAEAQITSLTGFGTDTISLSGSGNGSLVFYYGVSDPDTFGDYNCSYTSNCSWSSTVGSGFGYAFEGQYYFIEVINTTACNSLDYESCLALGEYVGCADNSNTTTWEDCGSPPPSDNDLNVLGVIQQAINAIAIIFSLLFMLWWFITWMMRDSLKI